MEMLVVARVLSRPEPPLSERSNGYYVSKSWCRAALKWLDVQAEERRQREQKILDDVAAAQKAAASTSGKQVKYKHHQHQQPKQKKKSKRQERKISNSTITPPPPLNVNDDITCEHGCLKYCGSGRTSRTKRRVLDKQAWKVLKKLYPQGAQLSSLDGECLQCALEVETEKRTEEMQKQRETEERKKPLSCPLVRGIYSRRSGVPKECLFFQQQQSDGISSPVARKLPVLRNGSICPLVPGVYNVLPRAWCHRWRKYTKTGEGGRPPAPDTSACLCDAHRLPLVPPHLEAFLHGNTSSLLDADVKDESSVTESPQTPRALPVGFYPLSQRLGGGGTPNDGTGNPRERSIGGQTYTPRAQRALDDDVSYLRASGMSEAEIQLQRLAMLQIEEQRALQERALQEQRALQEHAEQRRRHAMNNMGAAAAVGIPMSSEEVRAKVNAQLDRENKVVVEILTDEELEALEKWWPGIHSSYALKFAVVELDAGAMDIIWTTQPCGDCDASGKASEYDFSVRNRNRNWVNNTPKKRYGK